MTIYRSKHTDKSTKLDNGFIHDSTISDRARGLLAYMLSRPDDWKFTEKELVQSGPDGATAIRTALKELTARGYLRRSRYRVNGHFGGVQWDIFESPMEAQAYDNSQN